MGQGLQLAGASDALWQLLAQRKAESIAAQQYADKQKQQEFQNTLDVRGMEQNDALRRDQLARQTKNDQLADEDRRLRIGTQMNDQIPAGFLPQGNQAVGFLRSVGAGQDVPATQPMGPDFVGPMPNGESPQEAQVGRPAGFLKMASAKQLDTEADNQRQATTAAQAAADKAATLTREQTRDTEITRHNKAMENKQPAGADRRRADRGRQRQSRHEDRAEDRWAPSSKRGRARSRRTASIARKRCSRPARTSSRN
jgi:hypothetical protein